MPITENKERYTLYNLTEAGGSSTKYVANLTISNITDSDHLHIYYLTVTNLKGSQNYYFDVNITDFVPTTTTPVPTTTIGTTPGIATEKSNGAVTAIVVIVVLSIVVVGGVIFYKKYYLNRQTVPHYNLR